MVISEDIRTHISRGTGKLVQVIYASLEDDGMRSTSPTWDDPQSRNCHLPPTCPGAEVAVDGVAVSVLECLDSLTTSGADPFLGVVDRIRALVLDSWNHGLLQKWVHPSSECYGRTVSSRDIDQKYINELHHLLIRRYTNRTPLMLTLGQEKVPPTSLRMAEQKLQHPKAVAIIGSGMAGLVSAYLLRNDERQRFDVEIFETQDRLSLDSASHTVDNVSTKQDRIDLPMRAFSGGFYDNLKRMYDYLGVESISPRFIYSMFKDDSSKDTTPYFIHSSNNHRLPLRPEDSPFGSWILQVCYLAICYFWFTACCFLIRPKPAETSREEESLRQYLERVRIPWYYTKNYLLPLMSSVTTCTHDALLEFPAIDIVDYARGTFRQPHYTVLGGVDRVQRILSKGQKVKFGTTVTAVENVGSKVQVTWKEAGTGQTDSTLYDHVIMGVTPNVVGSIFQPLTGAMADIPTVSVESVVHNDHTKITHTSDALRRNLQTELPPQSSTPPQPIHICSNATATESIHEHPSSKLITTFPLSPIDPSKVIHRAKFTRVLRTPRSREVVNSIFTDQLPQRNRKDEKQGLWRNGDGNVWLVGGWCWDGMVMLEGCIVSAMRMADGLGVEVPWRAKNSY